jgi:predicted ATPase
MCVASEFGFELGVPTYGFAAWCLWLLGYPDQALCLADEALATAERIRHDYTRCRGLYYNSAFHAFRREWLIVEERATATIASAQEHGLAMVAANGAIMRGAARAMLEPRNEIVAEIREAMATYRASGARTQGTYYLALFAQALGGCDRHSNGLSALNEAESLVEETGERYVEAEIDRLRGDPLLAENGSAEASYLKALEVSRRQEAKSWELRAATSLARLWGEQGRRAEARELLAPIYGWFTEGFDTPDLVEAKGLLDALS